MEKVLLRIEPALDVYTLRQMLEPIECDDVKWRGKYDGSLELYTVEADAEPTVTTGLVAVDDSDPEPF